MSSDSDERFIILKFSESEELKEFFSLFKESGLGSLVKIGDDPDGRNNQKRSNNGSDKSTKWSDWGMENLDEKNSEKPSLI